MSTVISAIGNAFAVLNDTEKRKQYDLYGPLEDQQSSMRRHSHRNRHDYSRGFEGRVLKKNKSFLLPRCLIH